MRLKSKVVTACLVSALLFSCFPMLVCADAAWLEGYERRVLFYWESSGAGQDSFTVYNQTNINNQSKFYIFNETQSDFEDLRVTLTDGITELSLWNETTFNQINCTIWANFPLANASYYLYWNNAGAVAGWNQSAVFNAVIHNVVLAYPFSESSGSLTQDYSGNNNNGVVEGASFVSGKFGNALDFESTESDYVDLTSNIDTSLGLSSDVTLMCWANPESLSAAVQTIFDSGVGSNVGFGMSLVDLPYALRMYYNAASQEILIPSMSLSSWQHFAVVIHPLTNVADFYFNGDYIGFKAISAVSNYSSVLPRIGMRASHTAWAFDGLLDDFFIVNGSLSSELAFVYSGLSDASLDFGKVLVRNLVTGNGISLFGGVESAPIVEPTVDPGALTGEDAVGVAVALCVVFFGAGVGLIFVVKKKNDI